MSLDLTLRTKKCKECKHSEKILTFNYTYNCWDMWNLIFPHHDRMIPIEGMTGEMSYPILKHAVDALMENPRVFEAMNPPNGWGDFEGFFTFVSNLLIAAQKFPDAIWEADR